MDILVSVIMPVYNEEKYLRECLDGLVKQTLKDIEVICVDDGSTDNSLAILKEYVASDSRFKVLQQKNQGAGIARNMGLEIAAGRYVIFLDSDDIFEPDMLSIMYQAAEERQTDVLVCRCDRYDDATGEHSSYPWSVRESVLPASQSFASDEIGKDFFKAFIWWPWDKLYRRSYVQELGIGFQGLRTTNDLFFVAAAMLKAKCISYVSNVLVHHRVNMSGSLSVTREKSWDCFYQALKAVRDFMEKEDLLDRREQDFVNYCVHFCLWQLENMKGESRTKLAKYLYETGWQELGIAGRSGSYFYHLNEYRKIRSLISAEAFSIKVSLILPSLNVHEYMEECLESAVSQTLQDIEIICVDAGSTDGTLEIIQDYVKRDSRVRLIKSDKKSYGYQMNIAIDSAQGEYIGIIETDDFAPPEMYEELYNTAAENEVELVKASFYRFTRDSENHLNKTLFHITKGDKSFCNRVIDVAKEKKCFTFEMNTWSGIYQRSFLEKNHIRHNETPGASFQDNGFWFQTMMHARRAYFVDKPYYMNRRDNPNSSVYNASKIYCICDEYDYLGELLAKDPVLYDEFKGVYSVAAFRNYRWTLDRISMKDKPVFYKRVTALCQKFAQLRSIDYKLLFEHNEMLAMDFHAIVHEPEKYFERIFGMKREILARMAGAGKILIYGTGNIGQACYEDFVKEGLEEKILGFAVTDAPEIESFKGVPVKRLEDWEGHEAADVIIAVRASLKNEVYENLISHGFAKTHAYPDTSLIRQTEFKLNKNSFRGMIEREYLFPFSSVKEGSRVVLYGAHEVGQSYYKQLEATGYAQVVQWLDDKYERHLNWGMPVDDPDKLGSVEFDVLVIAMGKLENVRKIGLRMLSAGVPLEKIAWRGSSAVANEVEKFFDKLFQMKQKIIAEMADAEKILIYGTGQIGQACYEDFARAGLEEKILGFAVTGVTETDNLRGVPVKRLEDWEGVEAADVIIAVDTSLKNEVYENLVCHGFVKTHAYPDSSFIRFAEADSYRWELTKQYVFPFGSVKKGSRVVLYGAYEVGQSYYMQLKATGYAQVVQWLDDEYERHSEIGMPVSAPDTLGSVDFDVLVIAMGKQKHVQNIGVSLLAAGVPLEKIVWMDKSKINWLQVYREGILQKSQHDVRNCLGYMKKKMEMKLKELDALSNKMKIGEALILPRMIVTLEKKGELLPAEIVTENIRKVLLQADGIANLQLLSQDIFAYQGLEALLKNMLVDGRILKIELLNGGKTMPSDSAVNLMQANDIAISLMHGEGEMLRCELLEVLEGNRISSKCVFPDMRVEEAAVREASRNLVLIDDKFYRCPEGELIGLLSDSEEKYFLGGLSDSLKARLIEVAGQEIRA